MMRRPAIEVFCLIALLAGACPAMAGAKGTAEIPVQAGGAFSVPVASIREMRFQKTIRQQYDFSCGSAALATLLTHHYNYPVTEKEVFTAMYAQGDQAKIRKEGFSLLDIKNYLAAHDFQADGYVADVGKLAAAGVPAIALIKERGYQHFVVLKGLRDGRVLFGDPAAGTRAVPEQHFREIWVGKVLFVIRNRSEAARFNADPDWRAAPRAPVGDGIYRGNADLGLGKRGPADF